MESKLTVTGAGNAIIKQPCDAPAPLVINGAAYVGCSLAKDHEGPHEVKITWAS